jgi:hypothetical protein
LIDDVLLAINDLADGAAGGAQLATETFDVGQGGEGVSVGCSGCVWGHRGAPVIVRWLAGLGLREAQK